MHARSLNLSPSTRPTSRCARASSSEVDVGVVTRSSRGTHPVPPPPAGKLDYYVCDGRTDHRCEKLLVNDGSHALQHERDSLTHTDAHRRQAEPRAPLGQLVREGEHEPRARRAERV